MLLARINRICVIVGCLCIFSCALQAAVLPISWSQSKEGIPAAGENFGYLEYQPNGTLVLRSTAENGTISAQSLLLFRSILDAIRRAPHAGPVPKLNFKIYGEGIEHKFPPFLESFIQRIQTYFSVYRYTDTSRPVKQEDTVAAILVADDASEATTASGPAATTVVATNIVDVDEFISIGENDGYITVD